MKCQALFPLKIINISFRMFCTANLGLITETHMKHLACQAVSLSNFGSLSSAGCGIRLGIFDTSLHRPFIITLSLSLKDLNNVERVIKHKTIIIPEHFFMETDHEILSTVILSLLLIQEGQLSVSGERMYTILVNRLED